MNLKLRIGAKFVLMGFIICAALAWVVYAGYRSSVFALNNFKTTTSVKYPAMDKFQNLTLSLITLRNKSNEITSDYSMKSVLAAEEKRQNEEKILLAALDEVIFLKSDLKLALKIEEIENSVKECITHSREMVKFHIERINFFYEINGVYIPLSAMISLRELDHMNWVNDLRNAIEKSEEFKGQADPTKCGFGKWYSSAEIKVPRLREIFNKFDAPHKMLHEYAPKIKNLIKENRAADAEKILKSEVMSILNDIKSKFKEFREVTDALYKEASDKISGSYKNLGYQGDRSAGLMNEIQNAITLEIDGFVKKSEAELNSANRTISAIGFIIFFFVVIFVSFTAKDVNSIIKSINSESTKLIEAVKCGQLDVRGNPESVNFEFREIVAGINNLMDSFVKPLKLTSSYIADISRGNIPPVITEVYAGDFNEIKNNLNTCINAVNAMITDVNSLSAAAGKGDLKTRADASKHSGDFKKIVESMNGTLDLVIGPLRTAADCVSKISKGNMPPKITDEYAGDFNEIKNNLNTCIDAVNDLIKDSLALSGAACEGRLSVRADASRHSGDYKTIIEGFNGTLNAIIKPVEEAAACLSEMAEGNLDISVKGNYNGDHAKIKDSLNKTIDSINAILAQVSYSADQVNSGSRQVSDASQSLSQSATEAASSIEEISATMQEINSQTRQNAENAEQASKLSFETRGLAEGGNKKMSVMKKAMAEINDASNTVAKIIKTIDEIAFQTNLLALNAAVEAARAGKHGRGFTVVAEEVRNLSRKSAEAARVTAEMIKNSIQKAEFGNKVAEDTARSLEAIVSGTAKVTDLIGEISASANEQERSVNQINLGLTQIDQVTQQNTSTAEESAAASQELLSQSAELKNMLLKFRLKNSSVPAFSGRRNF